MPGVDVAVAAAAAAIPGAAAAASPGPATAEEMAALLELIPHVEVCPGIA